MLALRVGNSPTREGPGYTTVTAGTDISEIPDGQRKHTLYLS